MAVTKTHPIKSTLKAAIDYICNPDKTDGKLLVSSFGCTAETADIEFSWTRRHAIDKGTNLGRHLIQAFDPGEVTPEEAHRIGMELAREVLGGKYEFVLTTHSLPSYSSWSTHRKLSLSLHLVNQKSIPADAFFSRPLEFL